MKLKRKKKPLTPKQRSMLRNRTSKIYEWTPERVRDLERVLGIKLIDPPNPLPNPFMDIK